MFTMLRSLKAVDVATAMGMVKHPEGGYFVEMYRSGSVPMTTKGQTDVNVPIYSTKSPTLTLNHTPNEYQSYNDLVFVPGRESRRPDGDIRRNCLTSIIWMPLLSNPILPLGMNCSDHVHYYQGGNAFQYFIYNPETKLLHTETLGPLLTEGQKLQVVAPGGTWKCGRMVNSGEHDYSLIGEAVAPGFDFHDFSWVTGSEVMSLENTHNRSILLDFVHTTVDQLSGREVEDAERYYMSQDTYSEQCGSKDGL